MTDIIPISGISQHLYNGQVELDVSPDDIEDTCKRWEAGNARDRRVAMAYRALDDALEQGRQLIDLSVVMGRGGRWVRPTGTFSQLPALAVVRADMNRVQVRSRRAGPMTFTGRRRWSMDFEQPWEWGSGARWVTASAAAPVMPPDIRPSKPKDFLFLWEAKWTSVREARPPIQFDPALLEHVAGPLYRVCAVWELSALEAAALR